MKIAVSGATGFIGRYVIAELKRRGFSPTLMLQPGTRLASEFSEFDTVQVDLRNSSPKLFELLGEPDVLIHLAWGGLPHYRSLHHFEVELPAHYNFLKGLIHASLRRVIVTGTCLEYGMQSGPLSEETPAIPSTPYSFAKDSLRRQLEYLKTDFPYALTWARLFYLYGEGQAENSLLPQLKRAVERGDRMFNMSGGEQLRDYLPVEDVARALVSLSLKEDDVGIVNVCSGKPISVRRLVEGWIEANNWAIRPNLGYYPYPDYEPIAFWGARHKLDSCINESE